MLLLTPFVLLVQGPNTRNLDALVRAEVERLNIPSASVAVWENGKSVYRNAFGAANLETKTDAKPGTIYRIASISKTFTSAIILQLVQEGKLSLDDPASKILDWLPEAWKLVTVRQLLSHTGGIPNYTDEEKFETLMGLSTTPRKVVETVIKKPLNFVPGAKFEYSNTGFVMLGLIAEKVDSKPFARILRERISGPLGLRSVILGSSAEIVPNRASGYRLSIKKAHENADYLDMGWPYAAGSVEATASDVAHFGSLWLSNKVVNESMTKLAWTPVAPAEGLPGTYGLGWVVKKAPGVSAIGHAGGINGFSSMLVLLPKKKVSVAVLVNQEGNAASELANRIAATWEPELVPKATPSGKDSDPALTKRTEQVARQLLGGTVPKEELSADMLKVLTPEAVAGTAKGLASFGAIKSFQFLNESTTKGPNGETLRRRTYRVTFESGSMVLSAVLGADGKFAGIGLTPG